MKTCLFILFLAMMTGCTSKKNTPVQSAITKTDSVEITETTSIETRPDTPPPPPPVMQQKKQIDTKPEKKDVVAAKNLPACLQQLVKKYTAEEVQNPPRKIYSYQYKGNTVYYVTAPCCDFFSELYNTDCKIIAYPDGGITGRGDGRAKDFADLKSNEKLVWEDVRK